ncbi:MAG: hypothetical protein ABSF90_19935 [Syntrophobacteraceae bacterium]|jgi:hypothetical protein
MTTPILRIVLCFVIMVSVIAFGLGTAGARGPGCQCVEQPDMTAFGFLTNPQPTCDRDLAGKAEDAQVPLSNERR